MVLLTLFFFHKISVTLLGDFFSETSGTPTLTSRGFVEEDFAKVADFFDAAVKLAVKIKGEAQGS